MKNRKTFFPRQVVDAGGNRWDWALLPLVLSLLIALAYGAAQMATPYQLGTELPISLEVSYLPYYLLRTSLRMFMRWGVTVFSIVFAVWQTKYRAAEKAVGSLAGHTAIHSDPGFLSITVTVSSHCFPGSSWVSSAPPSFAIFTSQAWNMPLAFYQSLKTVPPELREAAQVFHLSGWQRFWRLDLPYAMPALLWNMMMSIVRRLVLLSSRPRRSRFPTRAFKLPGIGSYIALAIEAKNLGAIGWRWAPCWSA